MENHSAIKIKLLDDLSEIVGVQNIHRQGDKYDNASKDATQIISNPLAAIDVTDIEQIPQIIKVCREYNTPLVARGGGSGLSGGSLADKNSIVLCLDLLDKIIEINKEKMYAIVEAGVITADLINAAAKQGLFYPPDPASIEESTIGGNIAECAGGLQCRKYGVTKDYVLGIEGYDSYGELVQSGWYDDNQIYDLTSLLIGSEGTLLIITKAVLKLILPPESRQTFLATFSSQKDAAEVVSEIMASGVTPAILEFLDGDAVTICCDYLQEDQFDAAAALLLIELDGTKQEIANDTKIVQKIINYHFPVRFEKAKDNDHREKLWQMRRSLSKAVTAVAKQRVSEDVCVPPSALPQLVEMLPDFANKYKLRVNSYGHAGDGNLHVNFLTNDTSDNAKNNIKKAVRELFIETIKLKGTISGEHGIGISKREYLPLEVSPTTIDAFKKIKTSFDPDNLINPDKIF